MACIVLHVAHRHVSLWPVSNSISMAYVAGAVHCTENPIYVFPEMKLRGLVPNSYIHAVFM